MAVFEVFRLIARLVGAMIGIVLGTLFLKRRSVRAFRRTLRRSGLSPDEADLLTERYDRGIGLCGILRDARSHHA